MDVNRISGFYFHDFLEVKRLQEMYSRYNAKLEELGYFPRHFPTVGLLSDLEKEKNHLKFTPEVYVISQTDYFLKPTSEAVAYPTTYGDPSLRTPYRWYQVGPVFRNESKYCRKYERSKQIAFFHESHGIFSTKEMALEELDKVMKVVREFLDHYGIPYKIHVRPPEDTFLGAQTTYAFDTVLPSRGKVLQTITLHDLGSNFSKAYKPGVTDFYGICWGHSQRLLGTLKALYGGDLKWIDNPYKILTLKDLRNYNQSLKEKDRVEDLDLIRKEALRHFDSVCSEVRGGVYVCPELSDAELSLSQVSELIEDKKKSLVEKIKKMHDLSGDLLNPNVYGSEYVASE